MGIGVEVTRGAGFRACQAAWKGCSTCGFCLNAFMACTAISWVLAPVNMITGQSGQRPLTDRID